MHGTVQYRTWDSSQRTRPLSLSLSQSLIRRVFLMAPPPPLSSSSSPRRRAAAALPSLPSLFRRQSSGSARPSEVPPLRWRERASSELQAPSENSMADPDEAPREETTKRVRERLDARKSVSQLKREERDELVEEVRELEAQLDRLRQRAGLPSHDDVATVERARTCNASMEDALHQTTRLLERLYSLVENELLVPAVHPLSTFIHLPRDMAERRRILRSMQDLKLRRGVEIVVDSLHHLDHAQPYTSDEIFTSATGEYHFHRHQILPLPNFQTARQLYDVYLDFVYNLEISVTEGLGQITLREDTDDFDPWIWNHRILTVADDVGCVEELNLAAFAQFYKYSPLTNSPMGVIVYDTVNIDDLFPYVPEERTCKDIQDAMIIYELRPPGSIEPLVVFKRASFAVQLVPKFPIPEEGLKQLQDNTSRWPNYITKFLREYDVSTGSPHGPPVFGKTNAGDGRVARGA